MLVSGHRKSHLQEMGPISGWLTGGRGSVCVSQTLVPIEPKNGSLRTQARLRILGEDMAGTMDRTESRSRASEVRARIRRTHRLDFLSLMPFS